MLLAAVFDHPMPKFRTHRKCVVSKSIVGKSLVRESMGPGLGIGLESSTGVGGIGRRPLKILLRREMLRAKRRDCMDEACGRIHARVWRMRRTRSGRVQPRDLKKPTLTPAKLRDKSIAGIFSGDLFPGTLGRKCPGKGHRRNSLQCAASSALGTGGAAGQLAKCWGVELHMRTMLSETPLSLDSCSSSDRLRIHGAPAAGSSLDSAGPVRPSRRSRAQQPHPPNSPTKFSVTNPPTPSACGTSLCQD